MKEIEFSKRIVVLMDCTETKDINAVPAVQKLIKSNEYQFIEKCNVRPLSTHPNLIDIFKQVVEHADEKFCIVLRTSHDAMFLSTIMANAQMDNKLPEYPALDPAEVEAYDVYDFECVPLIDEDGFIRECGFDLSMRVLMNDYVRLQQLNVPKGPKVEMDADPDAPAMEFAPAPEVKPDRTDTLEEEMEACEDVREVLARRKAESTEE